MLITVCTYLRDEKMSNHLGLERLSSHLVEQLFGRFRNHFNGQSKTSSTLSFIICAAMSMEYETNFNVSFFLLKRENFAGAHLNFKGVNDESNVIYYINVESNVIYYINVENIRYSETFIVKLAKNLFNNATDPNANLLSETKYFISTIDNFFKAHPSCVYQDFSLSKSARIYPQLIAAKLSQFINGCTFPLNTIIKKKKKKDIIKNASIIFP